MSKKIEIRAEGYNVFSQDVIINGMSLSQARERMPLHGGGSSFGEKFNLKNDSKYSKADVISVILIQDIDLNVNDQIELTEVYIVEPHDDVVVQCTYKETKYNIIKPKK